MKIICTIAVVEKKQGMLLSTVEFIANYPMTVIIESFVIIYIIIVVQVVKTLHNKTSSIGGYL